jgi:integrase
VLWGLKKRGLREATLSNVGKFLRVLDAGADLEDLEAVKGFIASHSGSEGYKRNLVYAYECYVDFKGLTWKRLVYYERAKLPRIPTEEKLNMIISASRLKLACMLSISKETGLRPIELVGLKLSDIDFEKAVIYPLTAKHGAPRVLKISEKLVSMLKTYVAKTGLGSQRRLFEMTSEEYAKRYRAIRNRLDVKVSDPTISMIRLYDFRHFFATTLYAKTKDILLVKQNSF